MLTIVFGTGWYMVILWSFDFMALFSGNSLLDIMSNCCHLEQKMRLLEAFSRVIMLYYTRQLLVSTSILFKVNFTVPLIILPSIHCLRDEKRKKIEKKPNRNKLQDEQMWLFTKTSLDKQKDGLFLIGCWLYAIGQYRTWNSQPNPHDGFTFECIINLVFNKNNTSCWCIFI